MIFDFRFPIFDLQRHRCTAVQSKIANRKSKI